MTRSTWDSWRLVVLVAAASCAGSIRGAVRPIGGATFDPPLVPTANPAETFDPAVVGQWFGPPEGTMLFVQ